MSSKEIVLDLVDRLPEKVSLLEIAREIEFIAGVREGFAEASGIGRKEFKIKQFVD